MQITIVRIAWWEANQGNWTSKSLSWKIEEGIWKEYQTKGIQGGRLGTEGKY